MNNPANAGQDPRIRDVYRVLENVVDPEIPVVNIVEMGMIADVRERGGVLVIDVTPTFVGCPALDMIRDRILQTLKEARETTVTVNFVYDPPWTTDRLSESARRKLKAFGLAPPGQTCEAGSMPLLERIACPFCESTNTELESLFGATLCRSIHYCHDCRQSFEHFKTV